MRRSARFVRRELLDLDLVLRTVYLNKKFTHIIPFHRRRGLIFQIFRQIPRRSRKKYKKAEAVPFCAVQPIFFIDLMRIPETGLPIASAIAADMATTVSRRCASVSAEGASCAFAFAGE